MIIIRDNYLFIKPKDSYEKNMISNYLNKTCIRINPRFEKMQKRGKFMKRESKYIATFKEEKNMFKVYKGNYEVYKGLLDLKLPLETIIDRRISNPIEIESTKPPRDNEQKKAISAIYTWFKEGFGYGSLSAPPAAGKTYMASKLITHVKERTLIVVDMNLLIEQFVESLLRFTNIKEEEIGFITGNEISYSDDKKIIIATAQTLIKKQGIMDELSDKIGFLIIDEVHVASANTFQSLIPKFKPMYQLGLSGTHNRDDKMDFLVKEAVGPIIHEITRESLLEAGSILTPTLRPIFLLDDEKFEKYNRGDEIDFRTVVDEYYNCPKAINRITNIVMYHYKDRCQLLICKEKTMIDLYYESILKKLLGNEIEKEAKEYLEKRKKEIEFKIRKSYEKNLTTFATKRELKQFDEGQLERKELLKNCRIKLEKEVEKLNRELKRLHKTKWFETDFIQENELTKTIRIVTGELSKKERNTIIQETNEGKVKILLTTTVMDKAVSINRLDTLYLLFSTRERANTCQRLGRVSRTFRGKKDAIVYDIIYDHYMSFYQFKNSSGECRMEIHKDFTKYHSSIKLFIWWLSCRFNPNRTMPEYERVEFESNYFRKYILDVNSSFQN